MFRLVSLFFLTMLIAFPAHGEMQAERERPFRGDEVAQKIQDYCQRQLVQKSATGITARELLIVRLDQFYSAGGYQPLWTNRQRVDELIAAVEGSAADGLNPSDYYLFRIRQSTADSLLSPAKQAQHDLLLTKAFLTLAGHLRYGKVDPEALEPYWKSHEKRDFRLLDETLQRVLAAGSITAVFQELRPQDANYDLLKKGLARYQAIAQLGGWPRLADGAVLKGGCRDKRIAVLRKRLELSGDLAAESADTSAVFSREMVEAVKRFQSRSGIEVDGSVGPATLRIMNIPVELRLNQICVNLERYRSFLHDLPPTCILVNIPGYYLQYIENSRYQWGTKVIVGQPLRQTPVFRAAVHSLVFNPKWVVPRTVLDKDVLPALNKDNSYLAKKQLRVVDEEGSTVDPASINWSQYSAANLPYHLQQRSGDKGALGRIKFLMPNPLTIYLHDTPGKELFDKSSRAFSSGCIRVQNPAELARLVLRDSLQWNQAKIQTAINTGKTTMVSLPQQIPVLLLYFTVVPNGQELLFREDIYNRDKRALRLLKSPTNGSQVTVGRGAAVVISSD
ncbi:MAG: L,D-transpeptidase family protein [Chlorobium sp.]